MAAQKKTVGLNQGTLRRGSEMDPRDEKPTLAEAGIDKHLADRARRYAAVPADEFEGILAERRERIETENKRVTDLDPASSPVANQTVQASRYFSEQTNGLQQKDRLVNHSE